MTDLGPTLFECQPVPRHFWIFDWEKSTHDWREIDRWKTPLHYGTAFHTHFQCTKCYVERIEVNEQYGP
jgi:hypothetical protein